MSAGGAAVLLGELFTPAALSPHLWLDATIIGSLDQASGGGTPVTADGDPVGLWRDQSGNSRNVTAATNGERPLYKTGIQHSLPALLFDSVDDRLTMTNATYGLSQPFTAFVVFKYLNVTNNGGVLIDSYDNTQCVLYVNTDTADKYRSAANGPSGDVQIASDGTGAAGNWDILATVFNGASSSIAVNGSLRTDTGDVGANNPSGLSVGNIRGNASPIIANTYAWDGYIGEVIVFNSALSAANILLVNAYLAGKWGIALT